MDVIYIYIYIMSRPLKLNKDNIKSSKYFSTTIQREKWFSKELFHVESYSMANKQPSNSDGL